MSSAPTTRKGFLDFLVALRDDQAMLERYNPRNLSQMVFHARNEGYEFTGEEVVGVVSALEASVILQKDRDPFDGSSRLWRRMWGRYHLEYLVEHVVCRHTDDELYEVAA